MFALLEENGLIVTKGEWKATLRAILEKYPKCEEKVNDESCSVVALVRVVRNLVAHNDPDDYECQLLAELRMAFDWLLMHCFSFRVLHILHHDPTLSLFATTFQEYETQSLELARKTLRKPLQALFRVQALYKNGTKMETIFFHDPSKTLQDFVAEVKQKLKVPDSHKITYMGSY